MCIATDENASGAERSEMTTQKRCITLCIFLFSPRKNDLLIYEYLFCFPARPLVVRSRRQLHYHSQRRDPKESVARPSSNYYEYESVLRSLPYSSGGGGGASRLLDNNSNTLSRQGELSPSPTNQRTYV